IYTFTFVPLLYVIALALALLVNQGLKLTGFLRSAFFAPYMVSLVVASVIWSFMLEDPAGVINSVIGWLGIPPQPWLGSTRLALQFLQLGYASALSVALFAIILVFSLLQLRVFRDRADE